MQGLLVGSRGYGEMYGNVLVVPRRGVCAVYAMP